MIGDIFDVLCKLARFKKETSGIPNINPRYVWDSIIGNDEVLDRRGEFHLTEEFLAN